MLELLQIVEALARISHTIFARSGQVWVTICWAFCGRAGWWRRKTRALLGLFRCCERSEQKRSRWAWDDAAVVTRCGGACQAGEPRALAAALRRTAAQPQTLAAGQLDAIAILMRRTLTRTSAPILSSLRRMVPQLALANACVMQGDPAHGTEQDVGERCQPQTQLVGTHRGGRGAIGIEIELALLDPVLHVATGTIELLVEVFGLAFGARQRSHDEARVGFALGELGLGRPPAAGGSSCGASST